MEMRGWFVLSGVVLVLFSFVGLLQCGVIPKRDAVCKTFLKKYQITETDN